MDERTLTALQGSIKKWEGIVAGTETDRGTENCPLCIEFYEDACHGCPVRERTGYSLCSGSPYDEWALMGDEGGKEAAQAELDFLRSLLPAEGTK